MLGTSKLFVLKIIRYIVPGTIVVLTGFVLRQQITYIHRYLAPDSFTYFTMVRKLFETGQWFSFSGLDHTTGIHMGYYFLLIPFYPLFQLDIPAGSFLINTLLLLGGCAFLYRGFGLSTALLAFLGMLTPYGASASINGMESSLAFFSLCLFAVFFRQALNTQHVTRKQAVKLGSIFGLMILARLDLILLVGGALSVLTWQRFRQKKLSKADWKNIIRELSLILLPFIGIFAGMAFINLFFGGSILPISGKLKSSFPVPVVNWMHQLSHLKLFIGAIILLGSFLIKNILQKQKMDGLVLTLLFGTTALWIYNGIFASGIGAWYGTLPLFAALYILGQLAQDILHTSGFFQRIHPAIIHLGTVIMCAAIAWSHLSLTALEDWVTPHQEAAQFLNQYAKPGEAGAELKDGVYAFYSTIPVYSLTGLANNESYAQAARTNNYATYFTDRSIRYVIEGSRSSGIQVPNAPNPFYQCKQTLYDQGIVTIFAATSCFNSPK